MESQTRQLADLAFLMQDYAVAIEHYQMCLADYRQDKGNHNLYLKSQYFQLGASLLHVLSYLL